MDYYFRPSAWKDLRRLNKGLQKRIIDKLEFYTKANNPLKLADKLSDRRFGEYRFRIGDYRVIFDCQDDKIIILAIGHRRDIYK